jgi:hypothetical protein
MDPGMRGACRFHVLLDMKNMKIWKHESKDIFGKLQDAYEEWCVCYAWIGKLVKAFHEDRTSLADNLRSRKHSIPDGVDRIHVMIECEPYQSDSAMARDLYLSKTYALEVLKQVLKSTNTHYVRFSHFQWWSKNRQSWNDNFNAEHPPTINYSYSCLGIN